MQKPTPAGGPVPGAKRKILIVEDEDDICALVRYNLEAEGFSVLEANDGVEGLNLARRKKPDLVILDLMLPGLPGLDFCRLLRERQETTALPILILTARASEIDKVLGLEMGGDDYITKPFSPRELLARVKALLRRAYGPVREERSRTYERGRLSIDYDSYAVAVDGQAVQLSLKEFDLLRFFVDHPQRAFSRAQILNLVWGGEVSVDPRTVDVHIRRLRQRLERDDTKPELILTIRGVGYKFEPGALGK